MKRPMAHRERPETWGSALHETFWFLVCVGLFIAITAVQ